MVLLSRSPYPYRSSTLRHASRFPRFLMAPQASSWADLGRDLTPDPFRLPRSGFVQHPRVVGVTILFPDRTGRMNSTAAPTRLTVTGLPRA